MLGFVLFLVGAALIAPAPRPLETKAEGPPAWEWSTLLSGGEHIIYLGDPASQEQLPSRLKEARRHGVTHIGLSGQPARVQPLLDGFLQGRLTEVDLDLALQRDGDPDTAALLRLARAARAHGVQVVALASPRWDDKQEWTRERLSEVSTAGGKMVVLVASLRE